MGIILSSFVGCGKEYLTNTYGDKIKIYDATQNSKESLVDEVMGIVDDYDIVFIGSDSETRELFNERNIDYDVFYPAVERKNEFLENFVRKRIKSNDIMNIDRSFEKDIQDIDESDAENCYKHKLNNFGEYIGNNATIMQYIDNIKKQ